MKYLRKSFEDRCIEEDRQDLLDLWDYDKNKMTPSDVNSHSKERYWIKCPRGIHESFQHRIDGYIDRNITVHCKECEGFGQWLIDNYGNDYYEKIAALNPDINIMGLRLGEQKRKIKMICPDDESHIFERIPKAFQRTECPYCGGHTNGNYVKKEESLGYNFGDVFKVWSDKNEKTPYDYYPSSTKKTWIKCENGVHDDYLRKVANSVRYGFRCPECAKEMRSMKAADVVRLDLVGQTFGELKVIARDEEKSAETGNSYFICECSCGAVVSRYGVQLKNGGTKTCGNWSIHRVGDKNSNWRGGTTTKSDLGRSTKKYNDWRKSVYVKDWYTCQCCGRSKGIVKHAHHILNYTSNEELRTELSNGITLCKECHYSNIKGSFHNIYGTQNNTPAQLEEYINNKRKQLGINIPFTIDDYLSGNILKPGDVESQDADNQINSKSTEVA